MRQRAAVLILTTAVVASAGPSWAIPAFARRYEVECHFCHEGFPKLNSMGQRFKERGFRMEREDAFDASKWARSWPVTIRAEATHSLSKGDDSNSGYIKAISAGSLGKRIAYWVDDAVSITEGDDNFTHIKPNNAWLRLEVVRDGKLYARGGRIEMDIPFTQARTPHLQGYDIYFANTGFETDVIGSYQEGLEVGGRLPQDVHWSAAVVKGRNAKGMETLSDKVKDFDANLFLRLAKRIDRHRLGAFAYIGRNTLALSRSVVWDDNLLRLGADGDVWLDRLNLYGVFMYGRNDNPIATSAAPSGTRQELSFSGGFVQADYHPRDQVALTLRFNAVSAPPFGTAGAKQTLSSIVPGIQIFIYEHGKLSFEYAFPNKDRDSFGSVQAEIAF